MAINTKNIKLTHSTLDNIKTKESPAEKTAFVIRLSAIGSNNDGIVNEMAKYRIYMLEFMRFAEQNKTDL